MKTIFESAVQKELIDRVNKLTVHSPRVFGKMKPEQGLHHINSAFQMYLGELSASYHGNNYKAAVMRLFAFSPIPIPREKAPTSPILLAEATYNIETEKSRFANLLERAATKSKTGAWPIHPFFGKLTGEQYGKLSYKHTDHHLQQFGV